SLARADTSKAKADTVRKAREDTLNKAKADTLQRVKPDTLGKVRHDSAPPGARLPGVLPTGPGAMAGQKPPAKLSRPPLSDRLIVRLGQPVMPGSKYLVETHDVKNITGVLGSPKAGFEVPKRPKPTLADSARALQARIDSA